MNIDPDDNWYDSKGDDQAADESLLRSCLNKEDVDVDEDREDK
jgi:hypothetical protein